MEYTWNEWIKTGYFDVTTPTRLLTKLQYQPNNEGSCMECRFEVYRKENVLKYPTNIVKM